MGSNNFGPSMAISILCAWSLISASLLTHVALSPLQQSMRVYRHNMEQKKDIVGPWVPFDYSSRLGYDHNDRPQVPQGHIPPQVFLLADPRDRKLIGRGKEGGSEGGIFICSAEDKYLGLAAI